jgi:hypothetical protein
MAATKNYNTALAKGHGIIEETLALLEIWEPDMTTQHLAEITIRKGLLRRATAKRTKDLVTRVFAPRYLIDDALPAKNLKILINSGVKTTSLEQLFFIYTARANAILHDFVCEVYWSKYSAGATHIATEDAHRFLENAYSIGKLSKRWSEEMTSRVARGLYGCLADFGLGENAKKSNRKILPPIINALTSLYIAHDLHFVGHSDNGILDNPDWKLFGLERPEVVRELQRVSNDHFILQYSGELMRISWNYQSMEEAIRAIIRSEL